MASQYDKLFLDWETTTHKQAAFFCGIFKENGFDYTSQILDCACGIGTQAIGLALLGYNVTGSDISESEIAEAKKRAAQNKASIRDYDMLLKEKPTYSAPYMHKTERGQRVSFQTWEWTGENYKFTSFQWL